MDRLFGEKAKYWVDSIYRVGNEKARARVIPNIRSEYFPPWHNRTIEFPTHQLEPGFFQARQRSNRDLRPRRTEFTGGIVQGGYYDLGRTRGKPTKTRSGIYGLSEVNLEEAKAPSPVNDTIRAELQSPSILSEGPRRGFGDCHLYCFNVGQGDSSLLVLNGNAYLIDTNIYAGKKLDRFIEQLRGIMDAEGMGDRIKALVVTHKHVDHLRGAHRLLETGPFKFDHFIINPKYTHATGAVVDLLGAVEEHIPDGTIDASRPFQVQEGAFILDFLNPTDGTSTKQAAPDINDSSIVFTVRRDSGEEGRFILTGDASYPVLEDVFTNIPPEKSVLSVSHHGSRTGTSAQLKDLLKPREAHISAGTTKSYKHPHCEALRILHTSPSAILSVSKKVKRTVRYEL